MTEAHGPGRPEGRSRAALHQALLGYALLFAGGLFFDQTQVVRGALFYVVFGLLLPAWSAAAWVTWARDAGWPARHGRHPDDLPLALGVHLGTFTASLVVFWVYLTDTATAWRVIGYLVTGVLFLAVAGRVLGRVRPPRRPRRPPAARTGGRASSAVGDAGAGGRLHWPHGARGRARERSHRSGEPELPLPPTAYEASPPPHERDVVPPPPPGERDVPPPYVEREPPEASR